MIHDQSSSTFCRAATAGAAALEQIRRKQDALVVGVTSAGIFIQVETRRVVFLSEGQGRGPLSIYTGSSCPGSKDGLKPGMAVQCDDRKIFFPQTGLVVTCKGLKGWVAAEPARPASPHDFQVVRLDTIAHAAIQERELRGMSVLLPEILGVDTNSRESELLEQVNRVDQALAIRDADATQAALAPFYGLGPGLTPSGDDFIIGILLMLSRWTPVGWDKKDLERLRHGVIQHAFSHTTALSASLIECAAGGQADERLIRAADHLACGKPDENASLAGLLGWGSSSGLDTLTGMAVAILAAAQS